MRPPPTKEQLLGSVLWHAAGDALGFLVEVRRDACAPLTNGGCAACSSKALTYQVHDRH